jgi:iron complex outermembrane receptor protein
VSSPAGQRAHVAFEAMYESARTTLRATKTDPIYLANGRIAFALRNRLELSLVARNLFDTHYATPAGYEHRQDAIAQDGRTFAIKLHYGI